MEEPRMLNLPQHGDERGWLVVAEGEKDIPFDIKRIFYIYGSDSSVVRGNHANRKSEFFLINVAGSCKVKTKDGLGNEKIFVLDRPHIGVYLASATWKEMYDFSEDSILLCLASEKYDSEEYIRDYDEFVTAVQRGEI